MATARSNDVNSDATPDEGVENSQTSGQGAQTDGATIAQVRELQTQVKNLTSRLQSQDDQFIARLRKEQAANRTALAKAAEIEGWDEATLKEKVTAANKATFEKLTTTELQDLTDKGATTDAPTLVPQQTQAALVTDPGDQANVIRTELGKLGLSESDLQEAGGIEAFIGKPSTSELQKLWLKTVGRALENRDGLALALAQRDGREQDAAEAFEEVEQYGNLGATTGEHTSGVASNAGAQRLIEKEIAKYGETHDLAGALSAERVLKERYGIQ